jgi:hypothetical protein
MTSPGSTDGRRVTTGGTDFVPELRTDVERRDIGSECVVWSPLAAEPTALDPIATVMLDVVDGTASIAELAIDVHETVGVPLETAQRQVVRAVERFAQAGLLTSSTAESTAEEAIARRELFVSGSTPCSENASRLGTVTLHLRFGEHVVRVACDSRRGARRLRAALADHVVDDPGDAPLAFVLTAPQGLHRHHRLVDRSGFVLSEGRGLAAGLHALASHLTALLPPPPGTVRIRARAVGAGDRTVVCLFPLLFFPAIGERELARAGLALVDRLALDVDLRTGVVANPPIPWPALAELGAAPAHLGPGGTRPVTAVVAAAPSARPTPPTQAAVVAAIAANGLHGSVAELLDAAVRLVQGAELHSTAPGAGPLIDVLERLAASGS